MSTSSSSENENRSNSGNQNSNNRTNQQPAPANHPHNNNNSTSPAMNPATLMVGQALLSAFMNQFHEEIFEPESSTSPNHTPGEEDFEEDMRIGLMTAMMISAAANGMTLEDLFDGHGENSDEDDDEYEEDDESADENDDVPELIEEADNPGADKVATNQKQATEQFKSPTGVTATFSNDSVETTKDTRKANDVRMTNSSQIGAVEDELPVPNVEAPSPPNPSPLNNISNPTEEVKDEEDALSYVLKV